MTDVRLRRRRADRRLAPVALALLLLAAVPAAAGAATVSVEPYVEPPVVDPLGSCGRYMNCPADMLVFTAAAGEANQLAITEESIVQGGPPTRRRFRVRDSWANVQAGAGCEQIDLQTAACTAGTIGPVQLGDSDDRIVSTWGQVSGGDGDDLLSVAIGDMDGDEGDDVLIGQGGEGGGGDDLLMVNGVGRGNSGDDVLRCFPEGSGCYFNGGPGNDLLTGGSSSNQLFGAGGRDVLHGHSGEDNLMGGPGDDRLVGGADPDRLGGGTGADRLEAREDRSAGEKAARDRVDCGAGRRDRAVTDRRDRVIGCERVTARRAAAR